MAVASIALVAITALAALATVLLSRQTVIEAKDASRQLEGVIAELTSVVSGLHDVADATKRSRQDHERSRRRDRLVRVGGLNEALQAQATALEYEPPSDNFWRLAYLNPMVQAGIGFVDVLPSLTLLRQVTSPISCIRHCAQLRVEVEQAIRAHDGVGPTD